MRTSVAVMFALMFWALAVDGIDDKKLVDMTYPFSQETLHWPTAKAFQLETVNEGRTPLGYWYSSYNYSGSEHVGTHIDAPFHFAEGRWTTEQIPLAQTIGPGVVVDVRSKTDADRDYLLQPTDIAAWEKRYGRVPKGAIVLMCAGWGKYWGDRKRYFGTDGPGVVTNLHFTGFAKEAAEFLTKQRGVKAVGVDTPSIDHGPSRDF